VLSEKMRITVSSRKILRFSETDLAFYKKYASAVLKTLRKPMFQRFLRWMLTTENIHEEKVENIHVIFFPFRKENGKGLAGRCNSKGEIYIYPKKLKFYHKLMSKLGKKEVHSYVKDRAKATLIHELLHLKYKSDEKKVRKLTKKYLDIFQRTVQNLEENATLEAQHQIVKFRKSSFSLAKI